MLSQGGETIVPYGVRAGILIVTMGLIVTLKLLDSHYRHFQKAASIRGRILEDRLNLNLTEDISFFYKLESWWRYVQALYYGFIALTFMLGVALLWNDRFLLIAVFLSAFLSGYLIYYINHENRALKFTELCDWSVDAKIAPQGTPIRITYTNLDPKDREQPDTFNIGWKLEKESTITKQESTEKQISQEAQDINAIHQEEIDLKYFENYDWLLETQKLEPGLYELEMFSAKSQLGKGFFRNLIADGNATSRLTIQITRAAKPETPVKLVVEKAGNP